MKDFVCLCVCVCVCVCECVFYVNNTFNLSEIKARNLNFNVDVNGSKIINIEYF